MNPSSPPLHHLQGEVQQLSLGLFSPLDHLQDGDGATEFSPQSQHLLVRRLIILTILRKQKRCQKPFQIQSEDKGVDSPSWSASSQSCVWTPRMRRCWWIRLFSPVWCEESVTDPDSSSSSSTSNRTQTSAGSHPRSAAALPPTETPAGTRTTFRTRESTLWRLQVSSSTFYSSHRC